MDATAPPPRSPKTLGRGGKENNNDACAQRRLQKQTKEQKQGGTVGCRSLTNAFVVNEPPSAHSAEATCKSCNKKLDPNSPWRLDRYQVFGRWPRSCFLCMQARGAAASLAAIFLRLKAIEAAVAAPRQAMGLQRALPSQHGHPLTKAPVAPTAASTTAPPGPASTPVFLHPAEAPVAFTAAPPGPAFIPAVNLDAILTVEDLEAEQEAARDAAAQRTDAKAKADAPALAPSTPPRATAPLIAPPGPMVAALLRPTPPSKLTHHSSPTTFPTPPVGPHLTPAVNPASPAPPVPPEPAAAAGGHESGMGAEAPQQLSKGQMKRHNRKAKADAKAKATAAPPWPASAGAPIQENGVESPRADLVAHDDYPPGKLFSLIRLPLTEALIAPHVDPPPRDPPPHRGPG